MQMEIKIPERIDFKGLFIPADIFDDRRLAPLEKFLASLEINGIQDLSLKEKAQFLGVKENTVLKSLKKLRNLGYIVGGNMSGKAKHYSNQEIKEMVLNNKGKPIYKCEWCGGLCNVLHEHHFPKMKSEGGNETVSICPNCHYEFHDLRKKFPE